MNYHNITHDDMLNGSGMRVVLWVAGCSHCCKECHNPQTWEPNSGLLFDEEAKQELFEWLAKPWTKGVTFSGGDPLHPNNRKEVISLMKEIKRDFPNKDIWLYTGYRLTQEDSEFLFESEKDTILITEFLSHIDVLVDGKFNADVRKTDILSDCFVPWRGDSSQGCWDVRKSLEAKELIPYETDF